MHNEFLVFCDIDQEGNGLEDVLPRKVWTGSYNISANATASWENAVMIDSSEVAGAYAREYGQIMAFSEVLDWTSPWIAPEYRVVGRGAFSEVLQTSVWAESSRKVSARMPGPRAVKPVSPRAANKMRR